MEALRSKDDPWWEDDIPFFDVVRTRAWVMVRRLTHSAHHRGQLTTLLRTLGRPLHSTYGPTADTGGLMKSHAPTIYPYPDEAALLAGEAAGGAKAPLPARRRAGHRAARLRRREFRVKMNQCLEELAVTGGELILYRTEDGRAAVQLRAEDGTVWLTQGDIAALFGTTPQNITQHIKAIYAEGELTEGATCKELLQVRVEGRREVGRTLKHYSLEMILATGYRVRSPRGTQFRQWATVHLREYLVKGFVLDDTRLKEPGGWDYFDELLARIREIRASEKRFYQKVRDIYAPASKSPLASA